MEPLRSEDELPEPVLEWLEALMHPGEARRALVRLRCPGCQWERALRLPRRGPGERRIERMIPRVPVRHWVFSLPEAAQPKLEADRRLCLRVGRACVDAVVAWQHRAAARAGIAGPWRSGAVSAIHRVGAALDANVHVHALVLDGIYARSPDHALVFHPLPGPRRRELRRLTAELRSAVDALLRRAGSIRSTRSMSRRTSTRVAHRVAEGPRAMPVLTPDPPPDSAPALIQREGQLDVRAGPPVAEDDHHTRARLCRYVVRSPVDPLALEPGPTGRIRYRLRHPFADGTTHVEFSVPALADRLKALVIGGPRPPLTFHGVLAPGAAARWLGRSPAQQLALTLKSAPAPSRTLRSPARCPRCDTPMEIVEVEPIPERAA